MPEQLVGKCAVGAMLMVVMAGSPASGQKHASACTGTVNDSIPTTAKPGLVAGPHTLIVNDVRLWYCIAGRSAGNAPPVVFLHGGPGQGSYHFAALAGPVMEQRMRMVYFDQRASGRSGKSPNGEYSISMLVDDIEALRRALGVPRIVLLGHSFGGTLALEYAAKYPAHTAAVVFVSGLWSIPIQCELRVKTLAEHRPEAYARVRGDTLDDQGQRRSGCDLEFRAFASGAAREAYNNEVMFPDSVVRLRLDSTVVASGTRNTGELGGALFRGGLLQYRFADFSRLTMPVLVVAGKHDGAARPEGLRELANRLPNATFEEYERSGHFVYLDEPERFARHVARFISRQRAR